MPIKDLLRAATRARLRASGRRGRLPTGSIRDWRLEDRCLLASNGPIAFPTPSVHKLNQVMYDGVTGAYEKTITVTNNSSTQYLYAFLEGANSRQAIGQYAGTAAFDPFDPSNQEYRGYIGYTDGTNNYAGLPPQSSITITVPLAFWDSCRIIFSTDGSDQFATSSAGSQPGAPFYFLDTNTQATYFGNITTNGSNQYQLDFTPIYDSFDAANGGMPTTSAWQSPITQGILQGGQTYTVTGPGLPPGGDQVTIDAGSPNSITLPGQASVQTAQQYVFTAESGQSISPTATYIQPDFSLTTGGTTTTNGLVMWYHALNAKAPNNDAPFQLTEATFRGTFYDPKINVGTGFQYLVGSDVIGGADTNSADYDLSFVDSINLPVAMEATNVTVPNTTTSTPFGWVGSSQTLDAFQSAVTAFTSPNAAGANTNALGTYFGGKGYPSYVQVDPGNVKLPSGQNLFLASPVTGGQADIMYHKSFSDNSVINSPLYALTSGGTGPSLLAIGGDPIHPSQGQDLGLNTSTMANQFALDDLIANNLANGQTYDVTYNIGGTNYSAGHVIGLYYAADGTTIIGVELSQAVPANASSNVYQFTLPQHDYAGSAIAGLWYSWAKYYADNVASTATDASGAITNGNILKLSAAAQGLVAGMTVTGPGVPNGTVVLSVGSDDQTIELSQVVQATSGTFHFASPSFSSIVGFDPTPGGNTPLVNLSFTGAQQQAEAMAFAQTVFITMSAWSPSVPSGTANGWIPLLANIIGGNLGTDFLPQANADVVRVLTDLSKSALRGVPDFTNPLYSNPAQWYPDPALPAGGQTYNVFNLDPFVWFIHDKLGLTAYAFALDDDIGNVNAGGATNIAISVGGLGGLLNKDSYTNTSPFGVVSTSASTAQAGTSSLSGLTNSQIVNQVSPYDYNHTTPGTLVNGPGVPTGTTAQFVSINTSDPSQSSFVLSNPLTSDAGGSTFAFFGPMSFTGTVLGAGQPLDTIDLTSQDAYNTLLKLGPLQEIQVTGEGIDPGTTDKIHSLTQDPTTGAYVLQLDNPLDPSKVSQHGAYYAYTFGYPQAGLIRDPGFEWVSVQGLTGDFNHGSQVTNGTVDWTFTDGSPPSGNWYAGIAYGNSASSTYTKNNPAPPQGVQVGFIQGDSSISQTVTLGGGTYLLKLQGALSDSQSPQTLNVWVDNTMVGTIQPTSTQYAPFSVQFNVPAGKHTILFQGAIKSDGTALIDAVSLAPASSLSSPPSTLAIGSIPAQSANEGSPVSFTAVASGGTSPYTYSLAPGAPAGATIDPNTGVFTWTPTTPGRYAVTIDATDSSSPAQTVAQTVAITANDVAPAVSLNAGSAVVHGASFRESGAFASLTPGSFAADVNYGDGTGLQPLPLGPANTFVLDHTYQRPGTYTVIVDVRDAFGGVGTAGLTVTAAAAPLVSGYGRGRDAFVAELYQVALGRAPGAGELKHWSRRLADGLDRRALVRLIGSSAEHRMKSKKGLVKPVALERLYREAAAVQRQTVRRHLPPPSGPLTLTIAGPPVANAVADPPVGARTMGLRPAAIPDPIVVRSGPRPSKSADASLLSDPPGR